MALLDNSVEFRTLLKCESTIQALRKNYFSLKEWKEEYSVLTL